MTPQAKNWVDMRRILLFAMILILASCSLFRRGKGTEYEPILVDVNRSSGIFTGVGANVPISFYNRRTKPLQVLNDLNIKYIRVKRSADNWNDILALRAATQRLKIKWIYSLADIPSAYLDASGQLADVDGFANWWAQEVDELNYQEVPADFIELIETPDLNSHGDPIMDADTYNSLLHATRQALDLLDYQEVGIIGPGLSNPELGGDRETWYSDLDQAAYETLVYWSVQAWEDSSLTGDAGTSIHQLLTYFQKIESRKQLFVSSMGTRETIYNGQAYPDPQRYDILGNQDGYERYYYNATFALPYGLRIFAATLEVLANSEATPFLYQLYDAPDEVKYQKRSWGLVDLNGQEKPVYQLLAALLKEIPDRAAIIPLELNAQTRLTGLAFGDDAKLIIALCNQELLPQHVQIFIKGEKRSLTIAQAEALIAQETFPPEMGKKDLVEVRELDLKLRFASEQKANTFQLDLEPQSILIASFDRN